MFRKLTMVEKEMLANCQATVSLGTGYAEAGVVEEHGLWEGSPDCTCHLGGRIIRNYNADEGAYLIMS
jgi:hypothetical protein